MKELDAVFWNIDAAGCKWCSQLHTSVLSTNTTQFISIHHVNKHEMLNDNVIPMARTLYHLSDEKLMNNENVA